MAHGGLTVNENDIQRAVFCNFAARACPGVFAFHPKNGSIDMRGRGRGIYTGLGVKPGIPDVLASQAVDKHLCRMFALELKRAERRGKKPTDTEIKQAECRAEMEAAGWTTGIAYGLDEALAWLENHGLLRGRAAA